MKIEIDIIDPPEGYSVPERKPVYQPFGNIIILIGECWVRASDRLKYGGESHICCDKIKGKLMLENNKRRIK